MHPSRSARSRTTISLLVRLGLLVTLTVILTGVPGSPWTVQTTTAQTSASPTGATQQDTTAPSTTAARTAAHRPPAKLVRKLRESRRVYEELMDLPERVPRNLQAQARCVAVIPRLFEGALGVGGRHGKGVLSCRDPQGHWSAPSFIQLSGGSLGLQVGFQASDVVLFFLTEGSVLSLLETQATLGGDASVAAGPVGRSAEATTDLKLRAEIYAYAKSKGLFAGVSVQGGRLGPSSKANRRYYGRPLPAKGILFEGRVSELRPEAVDFLDVLP